MHQNIPVYVNGDARTQSQGTIFIRSETSSEKLLGSLKSLLIFWGIAVLCVFIPALHFVLVPTFLILGIYYTAKNFRNAGYLENADLTCPHCSKRLNIKPSRIHWPIKEICQNCARILWVEPKTESKN